MSNKPKRSGVFIGAYIPADLKEALERRAASEHRTVSKELWRIIEEALRGKRHLPALPKQAGCEYAWCGQGKTCSDCAAAVTAEGKG